ncbi:hypothetical protein [Bradyrhizobium cenepequi]|uniref:hypothetical protein n=1 Tax=Bradyrhizobium cenepequi TaxID=2821403 RepID=UPI001CE364E5|nr:hypothetical protein [Bradyrhizobium cenepequi]MCA6111159.1 hypothetical protein [Bradyrhizobium cenepequi]
MRAICSIPLVRNRRNSPRTFGSPDTSKNASKPDGRGEFLRVFSMRREDFLAKTGIDQWLKLLLLFVFFPWCPWPAVAYSRNHLNLRSFYPSIAADTSRNTSKLTRGIS